MNRRSSTFFLRRFYIILLGVLFISAFFHTGVAMSSSKESPKTDVSISVGPGTLGPGLPSEERLITVGKELIHKLFPEDLRKSHRVKGNLTLIERGKKTIHYELIILFLYRETYTAVNRRVVFSLKEAQYTVFSVE